MGQHRQSQSNDEKNTADKQGVKQQKADRDKSSSGTREVGQQQQNHDTGRSQEGSDGAAPRAGGRDADNPSGSANQEDRRTTSGKGEH